MDLNSQRGSLAEAARDCDSPLKPRHSSADKSAARTGPGQWEAFVSDPGVCHQVQRTCQQTLPTTRQQQHCCLLPTLDSIAQESMPAVLDSCAEMLDIGADRYVTSIPDQHRRKRKEPHPLGMLLWQHVLLQH